MAAIAKTTAPPAVAQGPALSPALTAARDRLTSALAEAARINAASRIAAADLGAAEDAHTLAQQRLGMLEADAALGATLDLAPARQSFITTREALAFARGRVEGLAPRKAQADAAVAEARTAMQHEFKRWAAAVDNEAELVFQRAIDEFLQQFDRRMAVAMALADGNEIVRLRRVSVPDRRCHRRVVTRDGDAWRNADSDKVYERHVAERLAILRLVND